MNLDALADNRLLILDGGMGSEIIRRTRRHFPCPEMLNLEEPDLIRDIHESYMDAGADIITTNTFGATPLKLHEVGESSRAAEINLAAGELARRARGDRSVLIAGSMGPVGRLIQPLGDLTDEEVYHAYSVQAENLAKGGVDLILIETQIDILEARLALRAASDRTSLPLALSFSYPLEDGRTVTGSDPETCAVTFGSTGLAFFGINCGGDPSKYKDLMAGALRHTSAPLIVYANAGIPEKTDRGLVYPLGPDDYADLAVEFAARGARVIGGCCGTTSDHIRVLSSRLKNKPPVTPPARVPCFRAAGRNALLLIGDGQPFRIIGENINPFGRKVLAAELESGRLSKVKEFARTQEQAGADALDVNLGLRGEKDPVFYTDAVRQLQTVSTLPLVLDNNNPESLEAALKAYGGKAVINSVNGSPESIASVFPLARKHGAAVVLLGMNEHGIPDTPAERIQIIAGLRDKALEAGLSPDDLLADPIVLTVATSPWNAAVTLDAVAGLKNLGLPTTLGLSNLSFGLPRRRLLNRTFLAMAASRGLDAAIMNPLDADLLDAIRAADGITGRDRDMRIYLDTFRKSKDIVVQDEPVDSPSNPETSLRQAVIDGDPEKAEAGTANLLADGWAALSILEDILAPALKTVGDRYEAGIVFLPQLIASAQAMERASVVLESAFSVRETPRHSIKVILATVEGDLHDIGKNIVALVLRSHGFEVLDLGKSVKAEIILKAALDNNADIIGLSALMTTTMEEMGRVVQLKQNMIPRAQIIVGGAAVTPGFARKIGAEAYGKDAMDALRKIQDLSGKSHDD